MDSQETRHIDTFITELLDANKQLEDRLTQLEANEGVGSSDYVHIRDEKSATTDGGTFTSGAQRTRDLNTEVTDTGNLAIVAANQITLAAGTYRALISAPALAVTKHQARLYNVTDGAVLLLGTSEYSNAAAANQTRSVIAGRFTLAASKVLEVQHICTTTKATDGFGSQGGFATEVYTIVELWRE